MSSGSILIVGGYGVVGRRIAADLAPDYPGAVIVAGRNLEQAQSLAISFETGVRARYMDVRQPASIEAALEGVGTVMSCIDQVEPNLLDAAIERGLAYTDLTPHLIARRPTDAMSEAAVRSGARIVLGAGLAPGISSVLARAAADRLDGPLERVESNMLLSVGDEYGAASRAYILEEISRPYTVTVDGVEQRVLPFARPTRVAFPAPLGRRAAYLFPFSDQVSYPRTLGARTALTRLALDPPWLASVASALVRTGLASRLANRSASRDRSQALLHRLQARYRGRDWYGLVVEVAGPGGSARASLVGHGQAEVTAVGAAAVVRALVTGGVDKPGLWCAEEVVPVDSFLEHLLREGIAPQIECTPGSRPAQPAGTPSGGLR
jgi:saccharopine dehydrogenase (NAD+, L-lysine forming)